MITNEETGWTEATVIINGQQLSFAESMTLRVAVSSFRMWLCGEGVRKDLGPLKDGYDRHLQYIEQKLLEMPKETLKRCIVCGARLESHTDFRNGVAGHEINMPGMPQHGEWHAFQN